MNKSIGIAGAGASGCVCAYFLTKAGFDVTVFDVNSPLVTILPTGGGKCNLAHSEFDFRELAKNYPRGEKFLYSVFSRFSTSDTLDLFEEFGIKTYTKEDGRIFPVSNSSKDVREKILNKLKKVNFVREYVTEVSPKNSGFKVKTNKSEYWFSDFIISTGGRWKYPIKGLNHNVIGPKPSLVGLNSDIKTLSGIVLKDVVSNDYGIKGDLLFTHFGISGYLVYKISSLKAREEFPYTLSFNLYSEEFDLQEILNSNPHKELKNILSTLFPHRFAEFISGEFAEVKGHLIDGKIRDNLKDKIHNFKLKISGTNTGEETVTAGGYDLKEINSKTMESKIYPHLFIIGEVLDIDGFCGGFNLQNAWSTAFCAADYLTSNTYQGAE